MTRGTVKFSRQRLLGNVEPKTFPSPLASERASLPACLPSSPFSFSPARVSSGRSLFLPRRLPSLVLSSLVHPIEPLHPSPRGPFSSLLSSRHWRARVGHRERSRLVFLFVPRSSPPSGQPSRPSLRRNHGSRGVQTSPLSRRDKQFDALLVNKVTITRSRRRSALFFP